MMTEAWMVSLEKPRFIERYPLPDKKIGVELVSRIRKRFYVDSIRTKT